MSGGHTEGPWSMARDVGHLRVNDRHGLVICKVAQNRRNAAADLRLLASAPDLLQALEKAFANKDALLRGNRMPHNDLDLANEMRAAIAKARGTP